MKNIALLGPDRKIVGTLTPVKEGIYDYSSIYGDVVLNVEVERTKKGIWIDYHVPGIDYQKVFVSNKKIKQE